MRMIDYLRYAVLRCVWSRNLAYYEYYLLLFPPTPLYIIRTFTKRYGMLVSV